MSTIKMKLVEYLLKNKDYKNNDGTLNVYKVINCLNDYNLDIEFCKYLNDVKDDSLKKLFFSQVGDVFVLNIQKITKILTSKEYVKNSTTFIPNKVGMVLDNDDIILQYPFKDCILVGGMDKEDEKNKTEIFYNEIIESDKIDTLFSPKVFHNIVKFGDSDSSNIIVKGNNLIVLHSLYKKYKGLVDAIYIDPPYFFNGQKSSDSFAYNSNFKLSTWLTFMKNRLSIAKKLMSKNGVIFISMNEDGTSYLKILCNEIFGSHNFIGNFIRKSSSGEKTAKPKVNEHHEYILAYALDIKNVEDIIKGDEKTFEEYTNPDTDPKGNWKKDSILIKIDEGRNGLARYPIYNPFLKITDYPPVFHNEKNRKQWHYGEATFNEKLKNNEVVFYKTKEEMGNNTYGFYIKKYQSEIQEKFNNISTLYFTDNSFTNSKATKQLNALFDDKPFNYAKPTILIKKLIQFSTKKDSIVLDFFAGSGTTAHAVLELNKEDGGSRKFILVEQMDYADSLTADRVKKAIKLHKFSDGFTYCELLQDSVKKLIKMSKKTTELLDIINNKFDEGYFQYIDSKAALVDRLNLEKTFENQKKVVLELFFDHNREYINYSDLKTIKLTAEELEFNKKFYGEKDE